MRLATLSAAIALLGAFPSDARSQRGQETEPPLVTTLSAIALVNFPRWTVIDEMGSCRSTPLSAIPLTSHGLRFATWVFTNRETTVGVDSIGRVMYYADRIRGDGIEDVLLDRQSGKGEVRRAKRGERVKLARVDPDSLFESEKVGTPAVIASEIVERCRPADMGQRGEVRFILTPLQARAALADGTPLGEGRFIAILPVGSHTVRVMLTGCTTAELTVDVRADVTGVYSKALACP